MVNGASPLHPKHLSERQMPGRFCGCNQKCYYVMCFHDSCMFTEESNSVKDKGFYLRKVLSFGRPDQTLKPAGGAASSLLATASL